MTHATRRLPLKTVLAQRTRAAVRNADNRRMTLRARLPGYRPPRLEWLFLATLPNSGSTAFTKLLESAPGVISLHDKGEGQWLIPVMSGDRRWDRDLPLDYDAVRSVWTEHARRRAPSDSDITPLVVEKSPPNLVRQGDLLDAFTTVDPRLVVFTREPLAICASWVKRYTPAGVLRTWFPAGTPPFEDSEHFHRSLGQLCGERLQLLLDLSGRAGLSVSYEELTDNPRATLDRLGTWYPRLAGIDPLTPIAGVKNYRAQPLRNMNDEQIAALAPDQRRWLTEALAPYAATIAALGYDR